MFHTSSREVLVSNLILPDILRHLVVILVPARPFTGTFTFKHTVTVPLVKHCAMKTYGGVVSFTPLPLYPPPLPGTPLAPIDRRLGGPRIRSGRRGIEKNF
jgi:hypothetical protein